MSGSWSSFSAVSAPRESIEPRRKESVSRCHAPQRIANSSFHDPVVFASNPELKHSLTAYYTFIGCPYDLNGDKDWWHGSVFHYDFVMGANRKSPGLDMNILICCLMKPSWSLG